MKKTTIAGLVGLLFSSFAHAGVTELLTDDVIVKANRFERKDTETTYASEIHSSEHIAASGAATLYDYLAQQTTLNISSSFGSKATPSINLRGFGNENGSQNIVITVDGRRLNNIDGAAQLLSAIPLSNIERIEIIKGSGSVIYGDGATSGAVQIYTKSKTGVTIGTSLGNYGQQNHYLNAGISEKYFDLSANVAHDSHDGFSKKDPSGHKDKFSSDTQNINLKIKPVDNLYFFVAGTSSRNDIRYINYLSKSEFKDDPRQSGGRDYLQQNLDTDQWTLGAAYDITNKLKLSITHFNEDKKSAFPFYVADYDYRSNDIALSYNIETLSAIIGYQDFNGDRNTDFNTTTKDNRAVFINAEYRPNWLSEALTLSAGARKEKVRYRYAPTAGSKLSDSENLHAWDIGANYRINPQTSVFTNYNRSFQAPDIDRFFGFDEFYNTVFNGFISPAKANTINLGLNHATADHRFKATLFHVRLNDEIYLDPSFGFFGTNSNLDRTRKYGLELQDHFKVTDQLSGSILYSYTRAVIDKENTLSGSTIRNKDLPGAPKHTLVANLNYQFLERANLNINHTWRSKTYVFNDFDNSLAQKQGHYESTNLALNYQHKNLNFFASVSNLFEHENYMQTSVDALYPIDFVRTWRVGMRADF